MPTEIARDQNGLFHVVRDGRPIDGPFSKDGDAARAARRRGGLTSTVIGRLYYEAPRSLGPEPEPESEPEPEPRPEPLTEPEPPIEGATLAFIAEEGDTAEDGTPIPPGTPVFEVDDPTVVVDPEHLGPPENAVVTRVSVPELLAGTVDFIRGALATETWDDLLDEIEATETAGKNRKGVHEAVASRRASEG